VSLVANSFYEKKCFFKGIFSNKNKELLGG
jgi:hypothetical protein